MGKGKQGLPSDAAGRFDVKTFTSDGKNFSEAIIHLDFNKTNKVTKANFNLGYDKFGGLKDKASRYAELAGHEFYHAVYATEYPSLAVQAQQAIDAANAALEQPHSGPSNPLPPDVIQKLSTAAPHIVSSEIGAQRVEKQINADLKQNK